MPLKDKEARKAYEKNDFTPTIGIRMLRNDENEKFLENLKEAAQNKGISIQKYMILATKEKLDRDGYI